VLLLAGEDQTRKVHFNNPTEFAAVAAILRADPDHAVFFDPANGTFASGKDTP
jgi:hypothetical protein